MRGLGGVGKLLAVVLVAAGVAWLPTGAEAISVDFIFSGDQPGNTGPWGTVTFTDAGGGNTLVTMSALGGATGLAAGEFITFWGVNTSDTSFTVGSLTNVVGSATGTITTCFATCGDAQFKADGDGFYNIVVSFETANNSGRLTGGETVSFLVTGAAVGTFSPLSAPGGGAGTYNTAIHIQGIATGCSAWAGNSTSTGKVGDGIGDACGSVPEPGGLALALSGLVSVGGLIGTRFFNRNRREAA